MKIALITGIEHNVSLEITSLGQAQAGWMIMEALGWFSSHNKGRDSIDFKVGVFTESRAYNLEAAQMAMNFPEGNHDLRFTLLHPMWCSSGSEEQKVQELVAGIEEQAVHHPFFFVFAWVSEDHYFPALCRLLGITIPKEFPPYGRATLIFLDTKEKTVEFRPLPYNRPR